MLREIAARLGVQVDAKALEGFLGTLDMAKGKLLALGGAFAATMAVDWVKNQIDAAAQIGKAASKVGVSTDEFQEFAYAMKGSTEEAEKALFILNRTLGAAASGTGDATKKFASMGVELKGTDGRIRPLADLLPDIADKIANTQGAAEQTAIAVNFFGKSGLKMLPMLKKGSKGVAELREEFEELGGGISGDVITDSRAVSGELRKLEVVTKNLAIEGIGAILPVIIPVAKWFLHAAVTIRSLVQQTNIGKTALIALGVIGSLKLIPMIFSAVRAFTALRTVMFGVSMPFWLVFAAVAAIYLIFDDLFTLMTGGDSLIGRLADKLLGVGGSEKVVKSLKGVWEDLKAAWADTKTVFSNLWDSVQPILKEMYDFIVPIVNKLLEAVNLKARLSDKKTLTGSSAMEVLHPDEALNDRNINQPWYKKTLAKNPVEGILDAFTDKPALSMSPMGAALMSMKADVKASTTVTVNVPPGTDLSKVPGAVTDGVARGVNGTMQDAYAGVLVSLPGKGQSP